MFFLCLEKDVQIASWWRYHQPSVHRYHFQLFTRRTTVVPSDDMIWLCDTPHIICDHLWTRVLFLNMPKNMQMYAIYLKSSWNQIIKCFGYNRRFCFVQLNTTHTHKHNTRREWNENAWKMMIELIHKNFSLPFVELNYLLLLALVLHTNKSIFSAWQREKGKERERDRLSCTVAQNVSAYSWKHKIQHQIEK